MSKGTKVVTFRLDADRERRINLEIAFRLNHPTAEPFTFTSFILKAIDEKIAHMERSRKRKRKKAHETPYEFRTSEPVIHPPDGKPFDWEKLYQDMEEAERQAIDGER